jgi:hypothetical protein
VLVPSGNNSELLTSFFNGKHLANHPLRDGRVIILRLYGDNFQPGNLLGSHLSLYKLSCIYFQLENLPLFYQSKTDNILLTLCYHTEDVKTFGWSAVLKPLWRELKQKLTV